MALKPEIRLDVYSHNVKVTKFSQRGKEAMLDFCRGLAEYGLKMVGYKRFVREMLRVYAAATKDRTEFRFHRNQLEELLEHLKQWNYLDDQIEIIRHGMYTPVEAHFQMDKNFVPRDYQHKPIDYLIEEDHRTKILVVQTGRGKSQPLTSKVLTRRGWKTMGKLKVGDEISAGDGTFTAVTGIYPQGVEAVYRIVLYNGKEVQCSGDHLWRVHEVHGPSHCGIRTLTTLELLESLESKHYDPFLPFMADDSSGRVLFARVKSVTQVKDQPTQCISVDHPDQLYLTDDNLITHNTAMSLAALAQIKTRTALVIKGMYVDKWIDDVTEMYGLKAGELMVVRGSKNLMALIDLALAGELKATFIIITNKTLYNYLKAYERFKGEIKAMGYNCLPEDLFEVLGVGVRQIDEVHQDFHLNFRLDLYTHVPKTISLSATMKSDDKFVNRMYEVMFPMEARFAGIAYDKYIAVKALFYRSPNIRKLRFLGKRRSYSHVEFEKSIMKQKRILDSYFSMIRDVVQGSYISKKESGQKMLIFCATVDMCTALSEHLKTHYPSLDIRRYVSEDDYTDLLKADISVSTIKSAGTAVDIPDLRTCLLTDALSSRQANEQTVGRLRRLKRWPETTPEFLYFVCEDIPQHIRYHNRKEEFLADKVLSHKIFNLGSRL